MNGEAGFMMAQSCVRLSSSIDSDAKKMLDQAEAARVPLKGRNDAGSQLAYKSGTSRNKNILWNTAQARLSPHGIDEQ